MNKREFYEAIVNGEMNAEVQEFAQELIEKMDAANARNRARADEKRAEKEEARKPVRDAIYEVMDGEGMTASDLIEAAEDQLAKLECKLMPQGMNALLAPLVEEGLVLKTDLKVKGRTLRGYVRADRVQ